MAQTYTGRKRIRKKFGSIREVAEMPNLIDIQKNSYDDFLMVKEPPGGRPADHGMQAVFKSVFPINGTPMANLHQNCALKKKAEGLLWPSATAY